MNVHQTTTVMRMPTALIPLEVTTAAVTLAMREMDSTAQVIHLYMQLTKIYIMLLYNSKLSS